MDGNRITACNLADNFLILSSCASVNVGFLVHMTREHHRLGIGNCAGRAAAAAAAAAIARNLLIGGHGHIVHADPAVFYTAPLGVANNLGLQNLNRGAGQNLADQCAADSGGFAEVNAAVGVGDDAVAGFHLAAVGSGAVVIHAAFTDIQVGAVDPVFSSILANAGIQTVPAVLLIQNLCGGSGLQLAQILAVDIRSVADIDLIGVDDRSHQARTLMAAAGHVRSVAALDIGAGQVHPAAIAVALGFIGIAPDGGAVSLQQTDIEFNALGKGIHTGAGDIGFLTNSHTVGGDGVLRHIQIHVRIAIGICQLNPAQGHIAPGNLGSGALWGSEQIGVGQGNNFIGFQLFFLVLFPLLIDGVQIVSCKQFRAVGVLVNPAFVDHFAYGIASGKSIGSKAGVLGVVGFVLQHGHVGVGQTEPAGFAAAPPNAVDILDLVQVNLSAIGQGTDDIVIGAGALADVHIASRRNLRHGNHVVIVICRGFRILTEFYPVVYIIKGRILGGFSAIFSLIFFSFCQSAPSVSIMNQIGHKGNLAFDPPCLINRASGAFGVDAFLGDFRGG